MADNKDASTGVRYTTSSEGLITPALIIAAGSVLPVLDVIAVALRLHSRLGSKKVGLGADDWLIIIAMFLTVGLGVMLITGAALHAVAYPTELAPGKNSFLTFASPALLTTEKIFYAFNIVQCLAFGSAKLSVLFFYRRIFRARAFDIASITMIVIVCVWTTGFFFAMIFRCGTQPHYEWSPLKDLLAHCYNSTPMFQAFSISDVVTDLLIISIPMYWVNKLNLRLAKRLAICGIFLLGFIAIAAGVARLVFFIQQSRSYEENQDGIGHLTTEMYWSMIEMGISVIAACLPTIHMIFRGVTPENIIRKVRSMFSLPSQESFKSPRDHTPVGPTPANAGPSDGQSESIELTGVRERFGKPSESLHTTESSLDPRSGMHREVSRDD